MFKSEGVALVLRGSFAPAHFTPATLSKLALLRDEDMKQLTLGIDSEELVSFSLPEMKFTCDRDQIQIASVSHPFVQVMDFAVTLLDFSPLARIFSFGMNWYAHSDSYTDDRVNAWVSKTIPDWPSLKKQGLDTSFGRLELKLQDVGLFEGKAVTLRVERSNIIKNAVFFMLNEHYDATGSSEDGSDSTKLSSSEAAAKISQRWENSRTDALSVFNGILESL